MKGNLLFVLFDDSFTPRNLCGWLRVTRFHVNQQKEMVSCSCLIASLFVWGKKVKLTRRLSMLMMTMIRIARHRQDDLDTKEGQQNEEIVAKAQK